MCYVRLGGMYVQIEKLKYFVAVVESGSINKTAEKLHISQQALSQMIHNIEKELNMQLLNRTNKGVFLTKDGERLYDSAEKILDIWDAFLFTDKNEDFEFLQQDITLRLSLPVGMEEKYCEFSKKFVKEISTYTFRYYQ